MAERNPITMSVPTMVETGPELTASRLTVLRPQLKNLIASGARDLVLDLGACTIVDSSGIGLLVATHNALAKVGGTLSLVRVSPDLQELFQTMRLHEHFSISDEG